MSYELWAGVDRYIDETVVQPDPVLEAALASAREAGLPDISVSASQGKLLHLLARAIGARRILEVGTLGAFSTIWMGRALPADGRLVTLEISPKHAEVARANLDRAGLGDRVEVKVGPALETLPTLADHGEGPFDLSFIDADKRSNPDYFLWALKLSRPGSLIIVDNFVRRGALIDAESEDPDTVGVRRVAELMANEPRVSATAIQTVGHKGHDGFALALVLS